MQVHIQEKSHGIVITLSGRFVFDARKIFQQALKETKEKSPKKIVINLENVTYLDSAGLGLLALGFEQAQLENIKLCLVNPTGAVKDILKMAHIEKLIPIYSTEEEALRASATPHLVAR